ncbi:pyruvate kinase [Drosophila guanche]|uniref:Pyruvate kinase n=1 Tax=Drosophila guanche TaxID=7266 RepID=A0A3B0KBJ3_DROGU|nr:pyruvate kinase [Drosophila guanche]SPP82421.1 blast:Pyruvate kinase [Drosophila guanche]
MSLSSKSILREGSTQLSHICELDLKSQASHRRLISLVATISRSSRDPDIIYNMLMKGVNIFRMNFAHESHEAHTQTIELVNDALERIKKETGQVRTAALAVDTRGPQIRTGILDVGTEMLMRQGENIRLSINRDLYDKGNRDAIYVDYPNIINLTKPGDRVFIDDGRLFLIIREVGVDGLVCEVIQGGMLGNNCNVILPEIEIDLPAVSEKDMFDIQFSMQANVDFLFASAVRSAKNIKELRAVLGEKGKHIKIIAKIDSKIALSRFSEIARGADGILLSRADLGTQIPIEKLFITQKSILSQCNKIGKPCILASHVLESMRINPYPTRAECFDLANAVIDGADCIMLSSEVAIGPYPTETIAVCDGICREAEKVLWYRDLFADLVSEVRGELDAAHSLAIAAVETAKRTNATLIIVLTTSGRSAALVSKFRPRCPVMAVTRCERAARSVYLQRGVLPVLYTAEPGSEYAADVDERVNFALTCAKKGEMINDGDPIVIVSAWKDGGGFTNNVRVVYAFFEADRIDCLFRADRRASRKNTALQAESAREEKKVHM